MENYTPPKSSYRFSAENNRNYYNYFSNRNPELAESYRFRNQNQENDQFYYSDDIYRPTNCQCSCKNEIIMELEYQLSQQRTCHDMLLQSVQHKDQMIELLKRQNEQLMSLLVPGNQNVLTHYGHISSPPAYSQAPAPAPGINYGMNYMPPRYSRSSTPKKELLSEYSQSQASRDDTSLESFFGRLEDRDEQEDIGNINEFHAADFAFENITSDEEEEETIFDLSALRTSWFFLGNLIQADVRVEQLKMLCAEYGPIQHFFCDFKKGIVLCKFVSILSADAAYHGLNNRELFNVRIIAETPNAMEIQWLLKQLKLEEIMSVVSNST